MGIIRILDETTINQIAAGEVVERPASVVKELVENSVDAGATRIFISVKQGGKSFIQIRDNGCGMSREDALLSFEKHATSKIREIHVLFSIRSLGFRGEALSSIASVSQTTIVTRPRSGTLESDDYTGTTLFIDGGELKKVEEIGCPAGTTITVENLFFNVPARMKYLKKDRTELGHIIDVITSRALAYPEIFFELTHEGRRLILSPGTGDLLETISSVIGKTAARQMVELNYAGPKAEIRGYITKPSHTRANQKHIFLFINRRPVRSPHVVRAIREGLGSLFPPVRYPVGVIQLYIDPRELDVNIHPTKSEVKFQHKDDVFFGVVNAVKYALGGKDLSVKGTVRKDARKGAGGIPYSIKGELARQRQERMKVTETAVPYGGSENGHPSPGGAGKTVGVLKGKQARIDTGSQKRTISGLTRKLGTEDKYLDSSLPQMRPIGQIGNLFIVVETQEGMAVIDQHAAHERIMYERFRRDHREEPVKSQRLIEPISLELAPEEQEAVRAYQTLLGFLGFEIDAFGGNTFMVRTVPVVLGKHASPDTIYDIIDELVATGKVKTLEERKDEMLKLLACHSAIRGGEELSMPKIEALLEEMYAAENPFTCPHGRPTILQFPKSELEKQFKRTGF